MRGRSVWGLREAFGKAAWHWRQLCKAGGEAKAQRTEKEKAWGWGNGGECGRGPQSAGPFAHHGSHARILHTEEKYPLLKTSPSRM